MFRMAFIALGLTALAACETSEEAPSLPPLQDMKRVIETKANPRRICTITGTSSQPYKGCHISGNGGGWM